MVDEKKKPEDTPKETKKPGELKEEDLEKAAGGATDCFLKIDGVSGE